MVDKRTKVVFNPAGFSLTLFIKYYLLLLINTRYGHKESKKCRIQPEEGEGRRVATKFHCHANSTRAVAP